MARLYALSSQVTDPDIVQKTGRPIDRDVQTILQGTRYNFEYHQLRAIHIKHSGIAALR